jgi:hypothetical protein
MSLMRRGILRSIALFLTLISCAVALGQTEEITGTDYAVLSGFLRTQPDRRDAIRLGTEGYLVAPLTDEFIQPLVPFDARGRVWMQARLEGLMIDTIESFQDCSAKSMVVGHRIDVAEDYEIARPEEIKDLARLYADHPKANGYVHFSCVGVNRSGTQALFFVERWRHRLPNFGEWVLMERGRSGNWVFKDKLVKWAV